MSTTDYSSDQQTRDERSGRLGAGSAKARARVGEAYESARERASAAYGSARERGFHAIGSAKSGVKTATRKTADGVDANPVAALFGGLAIGALLAAVLPKSRREEELLGDVGRKINASAKDAAQAAREAGTGKLAEFGFTRETAKEKFGELASHAGEAARTSAQAAAQTLKSGQKV